MDKTSQNDLFLFFYCFKTTSQKNEHLVSYLMSFQFNTFSIDTHYILSAFSKISMSSAFNRFCYWSAVHVSHIHRYS